MSEIQANPYKLRGDLRTILEQLDPTDLLDDIDTAPERQSVRNGAPSEPYDSPKLDRMWTPWIDFNNATIESLLGPVLDDVISNWPEIVHHTSGPDIYRSGLHNIALGKRVYETLCPTINRIIRYICLKLLNARPVLMKWEGFNSMSKLSEWGADGSPQMRTDRIWWPDSGWLDDSFGDGTDPLPGLNRSTRESKLKDIFEKYDATPGSDITNREFFLFG